MTPRDTFSDNKRKALDALQAQTGVAKAAAACGLGTKTLYRYLKDPLFRAELTRRQDAALAGTTSALSGMAETVLETLIGLLGDDKVTASVKVSACTLILRSLYDLVGVRDVLARLAALEEKANEATE